ncbi:hypothetical protein [Actinoplanes utahensis]|uniref:hypothetical protein n=1 Tax=Actinoplanes utahensis TaxID=1869 RepID=UPI001269AC27|nr:hypothetical protein [Actinoplanes utahensis]GIF30004.1 hypothetical protein Aut01nite_29900 [Actinoplanes utahensis]
MLRRILGYLNQRVDPAPNPLRITVRDVDGDLGRLRTAPAWGRDPGLREQADRLLDVRAVLARHEAQDRHAQIRPSAASFSSRAYPSLTPTSMPL